MTIIKFPGRAETAELKQINSFADLVPSDSELDARAAELLPQALDTVERFPAKGVAEMLAYAAARLERVGFQMFRP